MVYINVLTLVNNNIIMNHALITSIGIILIFLCTSLGSSFVFFFHKKEISKRLNQIFLGFAAGVMLSASFFSLIEPALETEVSYMPSWLLVALAIVLGALFLLGIDKLLPHFHASQNQEEGIKTDKISKDTKMFIAVTIHNIPEGLSVGISFGAALALLSAEATAAQGESMLWSALFLAIGIGIQNIPEGAVVSLPYKARTGKTFKAFLYGSLSGLVEPVAACLGLVLAFYAEPLLPWFLAFAAGCMIYVVIEDMVPDAQSDTHSHAGVFSFITGFVLMMILDTAL